MEISLSSRHQAAVKELLTKMSAARIPFALGGAFALNHYTGIWRDTKDMDIFLLPEDVDRALEVARQARFSTWVQDKHWLAKARRDGYLVDLIHANGNWLGQVNAEWLRRAHTATVLGLKVKVLAPEEMIWSKAYVAHRERYDGADILHLLRYAADKIDWQRLLDRFSAHPNLLLSYLALFAFAYPWEAHLIPDDLAHHLTDEFDRARKNGHGQAHVCWGMLLDQAAFAYDVVLRGCSDPREILAAGIGIDPGEVRRERAETWKQQQGEAA